MPKKRLQSDSGVTLLEISFAMGILVVAISMLFGAIINNHRSSNTINSRSAATAALRSISELVRSLDINQLIVMDAGVWEIDGVEYSVTIELEDDDGVLQEVPLDVADADTGQNKKLDDVLNDFPNPIQVKITLAWVMDQMTDQNGEIIGGHALQLSTRLLVEGSGALTIPGT